MLQLIRKHKNKLAGWIVAGVCAVVMLGFGVGSFFGPTPSRAVAKVNDREISYNSFSRRQQQITARFRQQFGENFHLFQNSLNLAQRAIDSLITEILLEDFTKRLGLTASPRQIENEIKQHPYFRGEFNQQSYLSYLKALNVSGAQLESITRQNLAQKQLQTVLGDLAVTTKKEIKNIFNKNNSKVKIRYATVNPKDFEAKVDTSDEESLTNYIDDHSERYKVSKQANFSFIEFSPQEFAKDVEVTQEDLELYFNDHRTEFFEPKKIHLQQIFFSVKNEKDASSLPFLKDETQSDSSLQSDVNQKDLALETAKSVLKRLKEKEDFSELAIKFSNDEATKALGGELGWRTLESLSAPIREAASKLSVEEHSDLIETPDGIYIIHVAGEKPRKEKVLEEVRSEVEHSLRQIDSPIYAKIAADNFHTKWSTQDSPPSGSSLALFAKSEKLEAKASDGLVSPDDSRGIDSALIREVINLPNDKKKAILEVGKLTYIVEISKFKESYIPTLEDIRERVLQDYKTDESLKLAKKFAKSIVGELSGKPEEVSNDIEANQLDTPPATKPLNAVVTLTEVAARHNLKMEESEAISRVEPAKGIFSTAPIRQIAFRLSDSKPIASEVFQVGNTFKVIEFAELTAAKDAQFAEQKDRIKQQEKARSSERLTESLISVLRASANVWINPDYIDSIR